MTLRNRFLLIGFWVVLFAILCPILVLYALGYKVDLQNRQIIKTGSLIIRSEPQRADIFIDDAKITQRTNSTIRFLLPGDYNVKISKAGYQAWTKRLNIRSALVTWANQDRDFITLFFEQPKDEFVATTSINAVSIRDSSAVIVSGGKTSLVNRNRGTLDEIRNVSEFTNPLKISSQEILYYLLRYENSRSFPEELLGSAKQLESNDGYSALLANSTLHVSKNGQVLELTNNVSGFTLEEEHLWFIQNNTLNHANLNLGIIEEVATLNYSPINAKIIRGEGRLFMILDGTLFALNDFLEEVYRGVNYAYWNQESDRLVFANNNEVLTFDPASFRSDLIIRSSSPLSQPVMNQRTGYIFFLNEGKLKAIELDGRDHRNVYTLTETPAKSFLISDDGKLITLFTETEARGIKIRD